VATAARMATNAAPVRLAFKSWARRTNVLRGFGGAPKFNDVIDFVTFILKIFTGMQTQTDRWAKINTDIKD
jgi:hypothetical protein